MRRPLLVMTVRRSFLYLFVLTICFVVLANNAFHQKSIGVVPSLSIHSMRGKPLILVQPEWGQTANLAPLETQLAVDVCRKLQSQLERAGLPSELYGTEAEVKHQIEGVLDPHVADILVLVYVGSSDKAVVRGAQVSYMRESVRSYTLAKTIQSQLAEEPFFSDRKPKPLEKHSLSDLYDCLILVNIGYLSNPEERRLLESSRYRDRLAYAIACGLEDYILSKD
jgi:N-acetylmuramoyl-L-alanine amidase